MSLPQFYASSEQDVLAYIASLGEERSHDLDTLREYIAEDPKDSDLEEIEDRLNRMLEDYHTETDELAERLIAALEEKGATYGAERERVPIITGLTPDDLYDIIAVKKDTPGVRNLLSQKAFKIENAGDDDPVYPLLNEYRAADFKRGAYLIRAIRDLTLSGITVTTERSFNGTHVSKARATAEGKLPIVDVPALAYATNMTVAFTPEPEPENTPKPIIWHSPDSTKPEPQYCTPEHPKLVQQERDRVAALNNDASNKTGSFAPSDDAEWEAKREALRNEIWSQTHLDNPNLYTNKAIDNELRERESRWSH
jgi:hypothetical protein